MNSKVYIGQSVDIYIRIRDHIHLLETNKHTSKHLQAAWNKYGKENFLFEIIEECQREFLKDREQYWMDQTKCIDNLFGYNTFPATRSTLGFVRSAEDRESNIKRQRGIPKHTEESRKKISEALKGSKNHMWNIREKHPWFGKKHSKKTLRLMSERQKGENNPMYGKRASKETRKRMKEAQLKRRERERIEKEKECNDNES